MKYLKIFENFSEDEIKSTLKDLCLDLTDEGFKIKFYIKPNTASALSNYMYICKENFGKYFTFSEVIDVVLNIKDYLGDKWVSCGVVFVGNPGRFFTGSPTIKIDINWEDYDRLDQMFDTEESPIVDLVIYFNI